MLEIKIPRETANDETVMITDIFFNDGDEVKKNDELIEIETSKVSITVPSPENGKIKYYVSKGDEVNVDSVFAEIGNPKLKDDKIKEKNIKENNILNQTKEKNNNFWTTNRAQKNNEDNSKYKTTNSLLNENTKIPSIKFNTEKTSIRKRAEINNLNEAADGKFQSTIGINIVSNKRSIPVMAFENSIQDLVIYETTKLLSGKFKDLNGFYLSEKETGYYEDIIPGISFDDNRRLTVCAIPNVKTLSLLELRDYLIKIMEKFEKNNLSKEDISESTFTISDLSQTKSTYMFPLINGKQTFILGIIRNENIYQLFITFDHRVSEGLRISRFLEELKLRIESYFIDENEALSEMVCDFCLKSLKEEMSLGSKGFLEIKNINGFKNICRNCFDGW